MLESTRDFNCQKIDIKVMILFGMLNLMVVEVM